MFKENSNLSSIRKGQIEVICGSMFSGKTEELIRRLKRAKFAKLKVKTFNPHVDNRYGKNKLISHNSTEIKSLTIKKSHEILDLYDNVDIVGIDEAQFLDDELPNICNALAAKGVRVIVAGLDMDYLGKPFGVIPKIMAIAEFVTKVHAVCVGCGDIALNSHRTSLSKDLVEIGSENNYQALCRMCFIKKNK